MTLEENLDGELDFGKILFGDKGKPDVGADKEPPQVGIEIDFPTCFNCGHGDGQGGRNGAINAYNPKWGQNSCPCCGIGPSSPSNHGRGYNFPKGFHEYWLKEIAPTLSPQRRKECGLE